MKKINFEAGTQVSPAKVTIDNVEHNVTPAVYEGKTPLSPFVLNTLQDNIENELITTKIMDIAEELTIEGCAGINGKIDIVSGKSIQEGTPSPDNIVHVRNVGDNINLFDKDTLTYLANSYLASNKNIGQTSTTKTYYIKCLPNTSYTISKMAGKYFRIASSTEIPSLNLAVTNVSVNDTETVLSLTTSDNDNYLLFNIHNSSNDTLTEQEILNSIKIEKSLISTPYTKYNRGSIDLKLKNRDTLEKIISFPFEEGQVLREGDYFAEDGIHQKTKTLILEGTENWAISIVNDSINRFSVTVSDINNNVDNLDTILVLSNYFKGISHNNRNNIDNSIFSFCDDVSTILCINTSLFSTIEEWKAFLAEQYANGTPVIIEYKLRAEIIIPYTEEQEEAYYKLQNALMYEDYTNISCIDEMKPDIQVTYFYNNEINTTYGKKIDILEARIRQLEQIITSQSEVVE